VRALCEEAIAAALDEGAEYVDVRTVLRRHQVVVTKSSRVETVNDAESEGIGVRVLVRGAWGFAGDRRLTREGAHDAARRAAAFAAAASTRGTRALVPVETTGGTYRTPVERDPFSVSLSDKITLCLRAEEAMRHPDGKATSATVRSFGEQKLLLTSDGVAAEQELVECGGGIDAIAVRDGLVQTRSHPGVYGGSSAQAGWEYVEELAFEREAPRVAEQAAALLRADECPSGVTTVVLDADQMTAQLHESVGHPIELDRIYGTEAAYAGTSFLGTDDLGSLRYGSELMHVTADATTARGLGTFGFDDEGVPARREPIVEAGVLRCFLTSRETAARLGAGVGGSMRADGWNRMPLVRMTNLHLEPGEGSFDDLLADVDEGIYMETNRSWSIDDKRLNFQFGTQAAWEIRRGRLGRMLRDATYTGMTPPFWRSLDAVAGPEEWRLLGGTNCGKGQPGQLAHVSHGCSPARFRGIRVGVKG
jgi:TldD protein